MLPRSFEAQLDLAWPSGAPAPGTPGPLAIEAGSARAPKGVVYTKPWVVDLILDLAGYRPSRDLAQLYAVEPAAGEGAFFLPMIRRLLMASDRHGYSPVQLAGCLRAYELDAVSATRARALAVQELLLRGVRYRHAHDLADGWITTGDYLLNSPADRRADVVVGNPPYIRYDDIPAPLLDRYRARYGSMVGRGDIYIGFFEAAIRQLKPGGVLSFICADRWMRAAYGVELRKIVSATCAVEAVIEMHSAPAFENDVSAYPAVIVVRRAVQGKAFVATAGPDAGSATPGTSLADSIADLAADGRRRVKGFKAVNVNTWFQGSAPWPSIEPARLKLLQRLETKFGPLEDVMTRTRIGIGIATGADRVFITENSSVVEEDRLLPLAMSADTKAGRLEWSRHYLINPWDNTGSLVDLRRYPRLEVYFNENIEALKKRNVAQRRPREWYRTIDKVDGSLLHKTKLYFPDMKMTSNPTLDRGQTYPHHNLYFLTSDGWDLEVLGGLLLSRVAELFVEAYCVKMRGGTLRFQAQYLRRIRVPNPNSLSGNVAERLRAAFIDHDSRAATLAAIEAYGVEEFSGEILC